MRFNKSLRPRKPEGSLGRTAQDVHLDSHTAPELCRFPGRKATRRREAGVVGGRWGGRAGVVTDYNPFDYLPAYMCAGAGCAHTPSERERILCLMSSDVLRHIRDKLYETLNTNLQEKLVGCKTVYFGLVHLCRGDPCQDLGGKLNLEIWCPSGLKICILFSSKVKIYIKMRIKTFLGPV